MPGLQLPLLEEGNVSTYHADDFRQVLYSRVVKEVPYPRQLIPVRERPVCLVRCRAEFQHVYRAPVCASAFIANEHRTGCIIFDRRGNGTDQRKRDQKQDARGKKIGDAFHLINDEWLQNNGSAPSSASEAANRCRLSLNSAQMRRRKMVKLAALAHKRR